MKRLAVLLMLAWSASGICFGQATSLAQVHKIWIAGVGNRIPVSEASAFTPADLRLNRRLAKKLLVSHKIHGQRQWEGGCAKGYKTVIKGLFVVCDAKDSDAMLAVLPAAREYRGEEGSYSVRRAGVVDPSVHDGSQNSSYEGSVESSPVYVKTVEASIITIKGKTLWSFRTPDVNGTAVMIATYGLGRHRDMASRIIRALRQELKAENDSLLYSR